MSEIRKEFEAWFEADCMPLESDWFEMDEDGDYAYMPAREAWGGWQASRAALKVKLPENCCGHAITVDELRSMLEKSGIALEFGK